MAATKKTKKPRTSKKTAVKSTARRAKPKAKAKSGTGIGKKKGATVKRAAKPKAKKSPPKKSAARKTAVKKTAGKKAAPSRAAAKKSVGRTSGSKKVTVKKVAGKGAPSKASTKRKSPSRAASKKKAAATAVRPVRARAKTPRMGLTRGTVVAAVPAPRSVTDRGSVAERIKSGKHFYFFGDGRAEGEGTMKEILGGKGAGLAEMTNAGLPVPPGFTITTEVCNIFYDNGMRFPRELNTQTRECLHRLEKVMGRSFGGGKKPLLVSVRSGAKFSMPGMMDTVLNLGLNDETVLGLAEETDNERFAFDSYRRFIQMFGNVVLGIDKEYFETVLEDHKKSRRIKRDQMLLAEDFKYIVNEFKKLTRRKAGEDFPDDPYKQLEFARDAVFQSWNNPRAIKYRQMNAIPSDLGTAVNVQAMVFGNLGESSATGVGFTRNPSSGAKEFYGEFLTNAQGEDVVAGIRTPRPLAELKELMPAAYKRLQKITTQMEQHYKDVQDFEFTIQDGTLYMLQTRVGKRTAPAAVRIATEMVTERMITRDEALLRIRSEELDQMLHPRIDPEAKVDVIARGLAASPGAAVGKVVFTAENAIKMKEKGENVILVRLETNPDDIGGMEAAVGILTARGGKTSHAAVVARGMGKCCVAGVEAIRLNESRGNFTVGSIVVKEKQEITLNGSTGEVMLGVVPTIDPEMTASFTTLMSWADKTRKLGVRTNADTPEDAARAVQFGAEGIGLCRTEHMFFAPNRLEHMRTMILAETGEERQLALNSLLPYQRDDFKGIFRSMEGRPVTIRTLDPPLHEFLPRPDEVHVLLEEAREAEVQASYEESLQLKKTIARLEKSLRRLDELGEQNPMLGHRGCRLGITFPEITEMQARAIFLAAADLVRHDEPVLPEVMVPLVGHASEFVNQRTIIDQAAADVMKKYKVEIPYLVGTMIEVPRAALMADEIAKAGADFFSFGTNDLTQMAMGFSRDDAGKFLTYYYDRDILPTDPFATLDAIGVGQLIRIAFEKGRAVNPKLKIGICGEHGGDPDSIKFCNDVGLDYVSCSPFRVPIARLAAAQAVLGTVSDAQK